MKRGLRVGSLVLLIELSLFMYWCVVGAHGVSALRLLQHESERLRNACNLLEGQIQQVSEEITAWEQDASYREQYARQHLQLARPREVWYRY